MSTDELNEIAIRCCYCFIPVPSAHTLETGIPVEEGDSFLKLLQRGSCPEIQLGVGIHSELDFFFIALHC